MTGFAWFNDRWTALLAIGVVVVWQSYPFVALALLAGFQSISPDVLEAAKVDGATAWQRLRLVTLPMLRPIVIVLVVISTIWDFKIFDQVYVMTGGGPARAPRSSRSRRSRRASAGVTSASARRSPWCCSSSCAHHAGLRQLIREEEVACGRPTRLDGGIYAAAIASSPSRLAAAAGCCSRRSRPTRRSSPRRPSLWPSRVHLERYGLAFDSGFGTALRNSLLVARGPWSRAGGRRARRLRGGALRVAAAPLLHGGTRQRRCSRSWC